jgi:hypothetical protein
MTAEQIAERMQARRTGTRRWIAKCPAHADKTPSLSIKEGNDGRSLVHCHAGCPLAAVLTASGLLVSDLFPGRPPSPAQARQASAEREKRERLANKQKQLERRLREMVNKLESILNELGRRLARLDDDDPIGEAVCELFHQVSTKLHTAEANYERTVR